MCRLKAEGGRCAAHGGPRLAPRVVAPATLTADRAVLAKHDRLFGGAPAYAIQHLRGVLARQAASQQPAAFDGQAREAEQMLAAVMTDREGLPGVGTAQAIVRAVRAEFDR